MTVTLGKCCGGCRREMVVECPTVGDILAAHARFIGWGDDERGGVRCPDCLAGIAAAPSPPVTRPGEQLNLLEVSP